MTDGTKPRAGGKTALKKALKEIGLETPFEIVKAKDGQAFALFTDWKPDVRWHDVQNICLSLGLIASSPRGVIWLYANGEWSSPHADKSRKGGRSTAVRKNTVKDGEAVPAAPRRTSKRTAPADGNARRKRPARGEKTSA